MSFDRSKPGPIYIPVSGVTPAAPLPGWRQQWPKEGPKGSIPKQREGPKPRLMQDDESWVDEWGQTRRQGYHERSR